MEPDYISNVHKALSDNLEGFNKDEATFREELKNPEYAAKVHSALADNLEGFNKTPDEFYSAVGIGAEKKSPNQTEPSNTGSSESGLSSPEQNTAIPFKEAGNSNDGVGTFQDVAKESTKQVISPKLELPKDIELAKKHQEFLTQAEPIIKQQEVELERQKKIIDATTDPNVQRGLIDQYNNTVKEHQQSVASYNDIAQQAKDANQRISNNALKIRKFQTNPEFAQSAWNDFTNSTVTAASKLISGIGTTIEGVGDLSAGSGHNLENMNQEGKLVGEEYKDLDNKVTDKIGDYTRNVVDDISKSFPVSDKAKEGLFNGEMTTNKAGALLGQAIGSMAAVVGGTALGGGVGGFATGYSLAMDEVYSSAKEAGLDDNDAASISLITSLPIAALDLIGAKGALPKAQMAKEIGERVLKDIAGKKITKETVTESAGRITKEYMKEMATEGATEAGQTLIQKGAEAGYDAVSGEKKYNTNFKDAMMETMESAIIGAVSGGAVKGGVDVGHKVFTKSVDVVKKYNSKNFAAKEAVKPTDVDLKTELDAHVKSGVMSEKEAQEVMQNVENAKAANEGIPVKKNDTESNRIKKVRLALRRTELEEELKKAQFQSDKDAIKSKIEQIEEDYKALNNAKPEARKEGETTNTTSDEKGKTEGRQEGLLTENKGEEISPASEINNETTTNENKTETEAGVQHPESETKPNNTDTGEQKPVSEEAKKIAVNKFDAAYKKDNKSKVPFKDKLKNFASNLSKHIDNPNRPLTKLEEDVNKKYGTERKSNIPLGRLAEQNFRGRATATVNDFVKNVVDGLSSEDVENFGKYIMAKRIIDRNIQDVKNQQEDIESNRSTGNISANDANNFLVGLKEKVGEKKYTEYVERGEEFQNQMNKVLEKLLESGRISKETFDDIKSQNEFYAPFNVIQNSFGMNEAPNAAKTSTASNVLKKIKGISYKPQTNLEELKVLEGEHKEGKISDEEYYKSSVEILNELKDKGQITEEQYDKEIAGLSSPGFAITDILDKAAQIIYDSEILAKRNEFLNRVAELSEVDKDEAFFKKVDGHTFNGKANVPKQLSQIKAPEGFAPFTYYKDGKQQFLAVDKDVAELLNGMGPQQLSTVGKLINGINSIARYGVITLSPSFFVANSIFDFYRTLAFSKYGLLAGKKISDQALNTIIIPIQILESLVESGKANLANKKSRDYLDFMNSPAYSSGIFDAVFQNEERSLKSVSNKTVKGKTLSAIKYILSMPEAIGTTAEQAQKLFAFKRANDVEGISRRGMTSLIKDKLLNQNWEKKSNEDLANALDNVAYEIQNYAGTPNFAASPEWAKNISAIFQFFSARLKGEATDLRRLFNKEGLSDNQYKKFLLQFSITTLVPLIALALRNNGDDQDETDYMGMAGYERNNNMLIPTGETFKYGDKTLGDYVKIPIRGSVASVNSVINGALQYYKHHDNATFKEVAKSVGANLTPLTLNPDNISESIFGATTPVPKYIYETGANRNSYTGHDLINDHVLKDYLNGNKKPYEVVEKKKSGEVKTDKWAVDLSKKLYEDMDISVTPIYLDHFENTFLGNVSKIGKKNVISGRILRSESNHPVKYEKSAEQLLKEFKEKYSPEQISNDSKLESELEKLSEGYANELEKENDNKKD